MERSSPHKNPRPNNGANGNDSGPPTGGGGRRRTTTRRTPKNTATAPQRKKPSSSSSTIHDEERLKAIGKRTRELLDKERSQRKEIVRIDDGDGDGDLGVGNKTAHPSQGTKRSTSSFSKSVMKQTGKRRKTSSSTASRAAPSTSNRSKKNISERHVNVNQWTPYTQGILKSYNLLPKSEKSNIVRLHGLPIGTRVEHVLKFFSGLSPQRIFVLPTLNATIEDFDIRDDDYSSIETYSRATTKTSLSPSRRKQRINEKVQVQRHSNQFRVLVKFESYPVADSAVLRSGETLRINESNAASIAVTPIGKSIAVHMQKFMSIDGRKGDDLKMLLEETEDKIPTVVAEIIWSMFRTELGMQFTKRSIGGDGSYPCIPTSELYDIFPPSTKERQHKMVNLYNKLLDIYDELEKECTPLMIQDIDPYLTMHSPILRLTKTAAMWIIDQCEIIKKCLDCCGPCQYEEIDSPI